MLQHEIQRNKTVSAGNSCGGLSPPMSRKSSTELNGKNQPSNSVSTRMNPQKMPKSPTFRLSKLKLLASRKSRKVEYDVGKRPVYNEEQVLLDSNESRDLLSTPTKKNGSEEDIMSPYNSSSSLQENTPPACSPTVSEIMGASLATFESLISTRPTKRPTSIRSYAIDEPESPCSQPPQSTSLLVSKTFHGSTNQIEKIWGIEASPSSRSTRGKQFQRGSVSVNRKRESRANVSYHVPDQPLRNSSYHGTTADLSQGRKKRSSSLTLESHASGPRRRSTESMPSGTANRSLGRKKRSSSLTSDSHASGTRRPSTESMPSGTANRSQGRKKRSSSLTSESHASGPRRRSTESMSTGTTNISQGRKKRSPSLTSELHASHGPRRRSTESMPSGTASRSQGRKKSSCWTELQAPGTYRRCNDALTSGSYHGTTGISKTGSKQSYGRSKSMKELQRLPRLNSKAQTLVLALPPSHGTINPPNNGSTSAWQGREISSYSTESQAPGTYRRCNDALTSGSCHGSIGPSRKAPGSSRVFILRGELRSPSYSRPSLKSLARPLSTGSLLSPSVRSPSGRQTSARSLLMENDNKSKKERRGYISSFLGSPQPEPKDDNHAKPVTAPKRIDVLTESTPLFDASFSKFGS